LAELQSYQELGQSAELIETIGIAGRWVNPTQWIQLLLFDDIRKAVFTD